MRNFCYIFLLAIVITAVYSCSDDDPILDFSGTYTGRIVESDTTFLVDTIENLALDSNGIVIFIIDAIENIVLDSNDNVISADTLGRDSIRLTFNQRLIKDTFLDQTVTVTNVGGEQLVEIDFRQIKQFSIANGSIKDTIFHLNKPNTNEIDSSRFIAWQGSLSESSNGTILSLRETEKDTFGMIFRQNSFLGER